MSLALALVFPGIPSQILMETGCWGFASRFGLIWGFSVFGLVFFLFFLFGGSFLTYRQHLLCKEVIFQGRIWCLQPSPWCSQASDYVGINWET